MGGMSCGRGSKGHKLISSIQLPEILPPTISKCCGLFSSCVAYLSGTFRTCQHGANLHFFRVLSIFGPMHQIFIPKGRVCVYFLKAQFWAHSCKWDDTQDGAMLKGSLIIPNLSPLFLVHRWRPACVTFWSKSTSMQVARNSC